MPLPMTPSFWMFGQGPFSPPVRPRRESRRATRVRSCAGQCDREAIAGRRMQYLKSRLSQISVNGQTVKMYLLFTVTTISLGSFWGSVKHFTDLVTVIEIGLAMIALGTTVVYGCSYWMLQQLGYEAPEDSKIDRKLIAVIWTTMGVCSLGLWFVINSGPLRSEYD